VQWMENDGDDYFVSKTWWLWFHECAPLHTTSSSLSQSKIISNFIFNKRNELILINIFSLFMDTKFIQILNERCKNLPDSKDQYISFLFFNLWISQQFKYNFLYLFIYIYIYIYIYILISVHTDVVVHIHTYFLNIHNIILVDDDNVMLLSYNI